MKDIKYLNHIIRNGFLYVILYISLNLIYEFTQPLFSFILGLLALTVGYASVYFLNDYMDRSEDIKYKKANLYNTIYNHYLFFFLGFLCTTIGLVVSYFLSFNAFLLLLVLYGLNIVYSIPPFRLRNVFAIREVIIFTINIVKWYFVVFLMGFDPMKSPIPLLIMAASLMATSNAIYKRSVDTRDTKPVLYFFVMIAAVSWLVSLLIYPQIFFLFVPIFPALIYLHIKYKNKPTPNATFLVGYIVYFILVVVITKFLSY